MSRVGANAQSAPAPFGAATTRRGTPLSRLDDALSRLVVPHTRRRGAHASSPAARRPRNGHRAAAIAASRSRCGPESRAALDGSTPAGALREIVTHHHRAISHRERKEGGTLASNKMDYPLMTDLHEGQRASND